MKLIITDTDAGIFSVGKGDKIITDNGTIHPCIGCFGCWLKTPGECVIHDGYEQTGKYMSICDELIIVSKCAYGGFSPFVKNVLDRAISYVDPNFVVKNGEMHHRRRYKNVIKMTAYFYGENITENEKATARELVGANSDNFDAQVKAVKFLKSAEEFRGVSL